MANPTALEVMRVALQQYGYTEYPPGSNKTKYGKAYGWNGTFWCAQYAWWCGDQPPGDNPIYKSANAADIQDLTVKYKGGKYVLTHTANNDKKKAALPKLDFGDSISMNFNGGSDRDHTALIVGVWGNDVYCIEGNTSFSEAGSQSNGGCVALRKREYKVNVCTVRPKYKAGNFYKPTKPYGGTLPELPKRGYFCYKDKGKRVRKLQKALAWANGYDLQADSSFRGMTFAEVVIFQVANGLEPDGKFGKKCLDKMQSIIDDLKKKAAKEAQTTPETGGTSKVDAKVTTAKKPPKLYVPTEGDQCYDLSDHQGALSVDYFKALKKKGINCVILRSSYTKCAFFGLRVDAHFVNNIKHAIKAGMHIGIYHFSAALSTTESKKEAKFCLQTIEPYMEHIDLPVAIDTEFGVKTVDGDPRFTAKVAKKLGKTKMGAIAYAFTDVIKAAGYEPMVYANLSFFNNYFPADIRKKLKIWVAQYSNKCEYKYKYYLWQYTSTNGKLDKNYFGKQGTKAKTKTNAEKINERVIEDAYALKTDPGKYGYPNGKPKEQYKKDLNDAFPNRKKWSKQRAAGAACDVLVPVVARALGIDKNMPAGLEDMIPYMEKHSGKNDPWMLVPSKKDSKGHYYSPDMLQGGDFVEQDYKGKGTGAHTFYIVEIDGKKYIAEAQFHGKTYPHISKEVQTMRKSSYDMLRVYRARG